jgi:hypothetical protein
MLNVQRYRTELALELNLSEAAIYYNLKTNTPNGVLTRIDALRRMKDLLGYDNIDRCLDLINEN